MTNKLLVRGRLAPSPTGFLHLGNAWSFLLAWLYNRHAKGKLTLRIENIDPARSKPEFIKAIFEDLEWLGLDWDETCVQSERSVFYETALRELGEQDRLYKCFCTRKELRMLANAPHVGDIGAPYPGTCRDLPPEKVAENIRQGKAWSQRFRCVGEQICFNDLIQGTMSYSNTDIGGDFALQRSDGVYAYQLACAVDDGLYGINQVIRGRDLLPSAARQILLLKALGLTVPQYGHLPLLLDELGERLAKRHDSLSLASMRERGVKAEQITGYLGMLAGLNPLGGKKTPAQLLENFSYTKIPAKDISLNLLPVWLKA